MQDLLLIQAYKDGDTQAFSQIYERYIDDIYRYIVRKVGDVSICEDLTSQVWMKILNRIDMYHEQSWASFKSWIYCIARNTVIDFYRSQKENVDIQEILEPSISPDFAKIYDDKQKLAEVQNYLKWLPSREQEIIFLRVWDDLSYKEISEILEISVDNCKKIYSRTIQKVQANISLLLCILVFVL